MSVHRLRNAKYLQPDLKKQPTTPQKKAPPPRHGDTYRARKFNLLKGPSAGRYLKAERKELGLTRSEHDRQRRHLKFKREAA